MGLKVNFSKTEAESKPREIPPTGEYTCTILNLEERAVKPGVDDSGKPKANTGKPYWNVDFLIEEGPYEGNHLFANIMLFGENEGAKEGTLRQLVHFLKALGYEIPLDGSDFFLPETIDLMGKRINVSGSKKLAGYDKRAGRDLNDRFEVRNYKPARSLTKSGNSSILP